MTIETIAANPKNLRFGVIGAGFWAPYQIAAWGEVKGAKPVAICDPDSDKAAKLASRFSIPKFYPSTQAMLDNEQLDFIDVITPPDSHEEIVFLAADHGTAVITQKPMSATYESALRMVQKCAETNTPFFVHENWRWQRPIREVANGYRNGIIGKAFRAGINYNNNFPVFANQPDLKEMDHFILTDMGTHILDTARFLFGEAQSVYCRTASVTPGIKGEDVATVNLNMRSGMQCNVEISYATFQEKNPFPQTFIFIEGDKGSISLDSDYQVTTTTQEGTVKKRYPPKMYSWIDPAYALVQSSIVSANRNILHALQGTGQAETTGGDNLKTLQLVFSAYESAKQGTVINL